MIDAYTIGITLALDNGVATGIAAIRQDLAALDRAVATSTLGLLAMRRLSENLGFSAFAAPAIPPPAHLSPSPTIAELEPPTSSARPLPAPSAVLPASHSVLILTAPAALPRESNSLAPSITQQRAPPDRPSAPAAPTGSAAPFVLGLMPKSAPAFRQPVDAPPVRYLPSEDTVPTPVLSPQPVAVSPIATAFSALPTPIAEPTAPSAPRSISPQQSAMPARRASAAPKAPTSQATATTRVDAQDRATSPSAATQTQSNPMSGSSHGEIILDGARLGRWMSDRLARAASRPGSGTTAFDPRISALYPGAPSGS